MSAPQASNSIYSQVDLIIYPQIYFFSSVPRKVKGTTNLRFNQIRFLCVSSFSQLLTLMTRQFLL